MEQLEVLKAVANTLAHILTTVDSVSNDVEYDFIIRSMALAQIFLQMIGFTGENEIPTVINENGEYGQGKQLIISLSNSQKLD